MVVEMVEMVILGEDDNFLSSGLKNRTFFRMI